MLSPSLTNHCKRTANNITFACRCALVGKDAVHQESNSVLAMKKALSSACVYSETSFTFQARLGSLTWHAREKGRHLAGLPTPGVHPQRRSSLVSAGASRSCQSSSCGERCKSECYLVFETKLKQDEAGKKARSWQLAEKASQAKKYAKPMPHTSEVQINRAGSS